MTPEVKRRIEIIVNKVAELCQPLPDGKCRSASFALGLRLATNGISSAIVRGEFRGYGHWWVRLGTNGNDYILDATSGQFEGMPDVVFAPAHELPDYVAEETEWDDFEEISLLTGFDIYCLDEAEQKNIPAWQRYTQ